MIDERMVASKARMFLNNTSRTSLQSGGLKFWVLADSKNGYTSDINLYSGRRENHTIALVRMLR